MPYNIIISGNRQFSPGQNNTPLVQPWSFNPDAPLKISYVMGAAALNPIDIATVIKNYLAVEGLQRVIVRSELVLTDTLTPWAVLSGEITDDTPNDPDITNEEGYVLSAGNRNVTNTLTFQNLNLLTTGVYSGKIVFTVLNTFITAQLPEVIDVIEFDFKLKITQNTETLLDPDTLVFNVFKEIDELPEKTFQITSPGAWVIKARKEFNLTGAAVVDNSSDTETIITGVGNTEITVGLKQSIRTLLGNQFLFNTKIVATVAEATAAEVNVLVFNIVDAKPNVIPDSFTFKAIKGVSDAKPQKMFVAGFGAYTITYPPFIQGSISQGNDTENVILTPLDPDNLQPNTYLGNIIVTSNFGETIVPVTYIVEGSISSVLLTNKFNFTKELDYLNVTNISKDIDNITEAALLCKVSAYQSFTTTTKSFSYKLPFFNNTLKWHVGEIVERLFVKPQQLEDFGFTNISQIVKTLNPVYDVAETNLNISVVQRSSEAIIVAEALENIKFIPGKKPHHFQSNICFLSHMSPVKRATKTTIENINVLTGEGDFTIEVLQNKKVIEREIGSGVLHHIHQKAISFSSFNTGNIIDVVLEQNNTKVIKTFQLIPEGEYSFHLAYINQYNVLEMFECIGELSLNSEVKKITHTYYKDLVEHIETLDANTPAKIAINTGHVFRDNIIEIKELLRSKKVWLLFSENKSIELSPIGKKLNDYDSDRELYDYTLEFNINKTYDAEDFTF